MAELPTLNSVFHQPVRTRLAVLLRGSAYSFSQLKSTLSITDGNLDAHLKKFGAAGYLHSRMVLVGRPHTIYQLSESGAEAYDVYVASLRQLIDRVPQQPN